MEKKETFKSEFYTRIKSFVVSTINLVDKSNNSIALREVSRQVIRSSSSIGANFIEAQDASSRKDFFHRIGISLREAKETRYWLEIMHEGNLISSEKLPKLIEEINELIAVLISISRKNVK